MNNFGKIGDKVPARSHAFGAFFKEQLKKQTITMQELIRKKPRGNTAQMFKQSCMEEFVKIPKVKKEKVSYTMKILMGLP